MEYTLYLIRWPTTSNKGLQISQVERKKKMTFYQLLALASVFLSGVSPSVPPIELSFLIDVSNNALGGATYVVNFDILEDQLRAIFNCSVLNQGGEVSIGAYGYSSDSIEVIPYWTSPSNAPNTLSRLRLLANGESLTYIGLRNIKTPPRYNSSILFIVTSQGSYISNRRRQAIADAVRVQFVLGWRIKVIALASGQPLDTTELSTIDPNYIVLNSKPKNYVDLSSVVIGLVNDTLNAYSIQPKNAPVEPPTTASQTTQVIISSTASPVPTTVASSPATVISSPNSTPDKYSSNSSSTPDNYVSNSSSTPYKYVSRSSSTPSNFNSSPVPPETTKTAIKTTIEPSTAVPSATRCFAQLLFVLDLSQTAQEAASSSFGDANFDILVNQLKLVFNYLSFNYRIQARIGAFGYSGSQSVQILPYLTSPDKGRSKLWKLRTISNADSWMYFGLRAVTTKAKFKENFLFLVTAQGSNKNETLQNKSEEEADRVSSLGWNLRIFAMKSSSPLDVTELSSIDPNFVTLSDIPKSYSGLSRELISAIDTLCDGRVNPGRFCCQDCQGEMKCFQLLILASFFILGSSQICPPMELSFLIDLSENGRRGATQSYNLDLIESQFRSIFYSFSIYDNSNVSIGAYSYSNTSSLFIPYWTSADGANSYYSNVYGLKYLESLTYVGLQAMNMTARYNNSYVLLVISQGSNSESGRAQTLAEAARVRGLGWKIKVFAVQSIFQLDTDELSAIDPNYVNITGQLKNFNGLPALLIKFIQELCTQPKPSITLPPTTTTPTTLPPTTTTPTTLPPTTTPPTTLPLTTTPPTTLPPTTTPPTTLPMTTATPTAMQLTTAPPTPPPTTTTTPTTQLPTTAPPTTLPMTAATPTPLQLTTAPPAPPPQTNASSAPSGCLAQLLFLLDLSKTAQDAASSGFRGAKFDILENQLKLFFNYLTFYYRVQVRIGAFGYSGSQSVQILPYWTSPDKAGSKLWKLRTLSSAESRTYSGLRSVVTEAKYKENLLIVVSAQGSNNDLLRNKFLAEVDRVKSLGWNLKVIAVKGSSPFDVAELSRLDSNYITLSDRPKSYTGLSRELIRVIDTMCSGSVNPRATTTCKPNTGGGRHKHDSSSEEEY
ncbi:hypothetical protein Bpfe_017162 [Biomphalaria pfeifferi]|uniref:VWFA domain-containing protein n=1 Tax=Biomphalaria pfeifferi TaxID=112525 RepID=A0AAD8F831_BIOPF|nr:hypothetical protein Bpfe_017162 [Biomphalaria pfeifferi]